ncbi:DCC1-like thiol-disulfide oxidoreductase family protein [Methylomarinum vadi]|uniref:DCC1-like thiol-disulfide oxidoreductase family protein n=1 Tax=Methylomarinum vadi TaxID=438855 RepID=UPI0004DFC369|nr:DCC1-like thiol-disulfide oxidoreductase family protein [Methylomarinum vadi]
MYKFLYSRICSLYQQQAPATGVGLFRLLFGLVTLQETLFLLYFNHLIFDPIPYLDVEFPMIYLFICFWAVVACCVTVGYRCQQSIIANYIFWLVFVNFTPMQRDFDGGFDLFMIGTNFFLIFMPTDKAFAIDALRKKLARPFVHYSKYPQETVSKLAYYVPVAICLGFLYFDSAIHKMFAEHWRNGLGAWLPSSMPYYVSALDMSWLLNNEILQKTIGYTIIVFQFTFIFLFHVRRLRPLYFVIGAGLHLGITLTFNIYPFGLGMLIFYTLVAPFSWYRIVGSWLQAESPALTVFYDERCPLCNRTVLVLNHFDVFKCIDFKGAQTYAQQFPALKSVSEAELMTDLYALDGQGHLYSGVDTYAQILRKMRYTFLLGWFMQWPGIYQIARGYYRKIADSRARVGCDESCLYESEAIKATLYDRYFTAKDAKTVRRSCHRLSKFLLLLFVLQLNSSLHYGIVYRLDWGAKQNALSHALVNASNSLIMLSQTFLGITPHALYLHDHFEGYNHLIALTYLDNNGEERWLPFVNEQGRLLAPNWGRVHSMWANIAVTPNIDDLRLRKFIMKVTAFWGIKSGLNLDATTFLVKLKKIDAPFTWRKNLRNDNLSGTWDTIGKVRWQGKRVDIKLPENINLL